MGFHLVTSKLGYPSFWIRIRDAGRFRDAVFANCTLVAARVRVFVDFLKDKLQEHCAANYRHILKVAPLYLLPTRAE